MATQGKGLLAELTQNQLFVSIRAVNFITGFQAVTGFQGLIPVLPGQANATLNKFSFGLILTQKTSVPLAKG